MKTVVIASILLTALVSCKEPNYVTVDLARSPDGFFKAKLETLSEGGSLYVSPRSGNWSEYAWLSYGDCAGAELYWASNDDLILAYDRIELSYYVDAPHPWGGATVQLCNKTSSDCPKAQSSSTTIPSCNGHQLKLSSI